MRVTKLIREYVEKSVKALPKFKDISQEEKEFEAIQSKCENFKSVIHEEVKLFVAERIARFKQENNIPDDVDMKRYSSYYPLTVGYYDCELRKKADANKNARATAGHKAIEEILVNLELGGTRAELDEMLRKLAE